MEPVIREATLADLEAFYGRLPSRSTRAFVAVLEGKPIAVAGIALQSEGPPYFYSELRPEMHRHRKAIVKGARAMLAALGDRHALALADPLTTAPRFLSRLGFRLTAHSERGLIFEWGAV